MRPAWAAERAAVDKQRVEASVSLYRWGPDPRGRVLAELSNSHRTSKRLAAAVQYISDTNNERK